MEAEAIIMTSKMSSRRRHSEDEDEGGDMEFVGESKKRRMPAGDDIGPRLVDMIKKMDEDLGEGSLQSALTDLANTLEENLNPYEDQIIDILYECAAYLPEKITIFSTLVGILNSRNSDFGENLLKKFSEELHNIFTTTEEYSIAIRIITFLCDLGNSHVISSNTILDFLEDFVDLAEEENIKSDFFIYAVIHALPWIGAALSKKMPQNLDHLLDKIVVYLEKRKKEHIKLLQVWTSPEFPQQDYLENLWAQLQKMRGENWMDHHILRVYEGFEPILSESSQHELPSLNKITLINSKNHPLPRVTFRLFQPSDCPEGEEENILPDSDAIERFLVEEDLNWIIDNNYTDWKLCARELLNYYRKETVPLNYVIIEAIFGQLFRLPKSPHLELFYGALLIELCRSQANSMPQVLALAAEMLYQRADTMQPICVDRFVDWFSYHLSNFEYRWSWGDWAECVEFDSLHPKRIFVREVLDKCMRLSYHKKLAEFLPKQFAPIIPEEPLISYSLDDERHPAFEKAEQLKELIMQKRSEEDILRLLEMAPTDQQQGEDEEQQQMLIGTKEYSPDSVIVFFAVLLKLASKTLTHSFAALTRYHKIICQLTTENGEMQSLILRTLYDSWSLHKQVMTILVDKMVKMRILDPAIVQAWVFSDEMKIEFKRAWVWDVLSSAVLHLERQQNKYMRDRDSCAARLDRLLALKEAVKSEEKEQRDRDNVNAVEVEAEQNMDDEGVVVTKEVENDANGNGLEGATESQQQARPRITAPKDYEKQMDMDEAEPMQIHGEDRMGEEKSSLDEKIRKANQQMQIITADLELTEGTLRSILLNICHKFTLILTEHLVNCEADGTEVETNFYNFVIGRFNYVFLKHVDSMWKFASDLDQELFSSPTIEPRIRRIFEQFISLYR